MIRQRKLLYLFMIFSLVFATFPPMETHAEPLQTPTSPQVSKIAAGGYHSLALKPDGTVWAWGSNSDGQLGDNTTMNRYNSAPVQGLSGEIVGIAGGLTHSLVLKRDGTVWAWGNNTFGQLGDGTDIDKYTPVQVKGLSGVIAILGGGAQSFALKSDGTVWGWGANPGGQLGDGTKQNRSTPVQVKGLNGVVAIAGGGYSTLALKSDGTVWAWGNNQYGQLGDGTTISRTAPVQVKGLNGVKAIAARQDHAMALKSDGTVWTWGYNKQGQLGDGTNIDKYTPVQVQGLSDIVAISAGAFHSLALKADGTVWAWGENAYGELGDGTNTIRSTPVQISGLSDVIAISAGSFHSLALKRDGMIWAWGANYYGQLGVENVNVKSSNTPVKVPDLIPDITPPDPPSLSSSLSDKGFATVTITYPADAVVKQYRLGSGPWINYTDPIILIKDTTVYARSIDGAGNISDEANLSVSIDPSKLRLPRGNKISAGYWHSLALKSDGTVWAWGNNSNGELGDGTTASRVIPAQASILTNVIDVAAGNGSSYALKSDGTVWAWGRNESGQLGDGTRVNRLVPIQVNGISDVIDIEAYDAGLVTSGVLFLKSDGTVWRLSGNTTPQIRWVPNLTGIVAISAGSDHFLALRADGTVWAWGKNFYGQLGNPSIGVSDTPIQVQNLTDVIAVKAGDHNSFAVKADGTVWAWGDNSYYRLGDGTSQNRSSPVQILNLSNVVSIAAGEYETIALKSDGTVWKWGNGPMFKTPTQVSNLTDIIEISLMLSHTLALKSDGTVWAWGANNYGQLGNGTTTNSSAPVQVLNLTLGVLDTTPPDPPIISAYPTTPTNGSVTVTISYSDDALVKQYRIGNGSWMDYTGPVTVSENTTVYARAIDKAGNISTEVSLEISNIGQKPDSPTGFSVSSVYFDAVSLQWDVLSSADSYVLMRDDTKKVYEGALTVFRDDTVAPNTTYKYSLYAKNAYGVSDEVYLNVTTPSAPTVKTTEPVVENFKVYFEFQTVEGAVYYHVNRNPHWLYALNDDGTFHVTYDNQTTGEFKDLGNVSVVDGKLPFYEEGLPSGEYLYKVTAVIPKADGSDSTTPTTDVTAGVNSDGSGTGNTTSPIDSGSGSSGGAGSGNSGGTGSGDSGSGTRDSGTGAPVSGDSGGNDGSGTVDPGTNNSPDSGQGSGSTGSGNQSPGVDQGTGSGNGSGSTKGTGSGDNGSGNLGSGGSDTGNSGGTGSGSPGTSSGGTGSNDSSNFDSGGKGTGNTGDSGSGKAGSGDSGSKDPGTGDVGSGEKGDEGSGNQRLSDIADHWAKDYIEDLQKKGIVSGYPDGTFRPDQQITRAEFTAMLVRALNKEIEGEISSPFTYDVAPSDWFYEFVAKGWKLRLVKGFSETVFGPDQQITREQMFTIIGRTVTMLGGDVDLVQDEITDLLKAYQDHHEVSDWALHETAKTIKAGLANGDTHHRLNPKEFGTRAEAVKLIDLLLKKYEKI